MSGRLSTHHLGACSELNENVSAPFKTGPVLAIAQSVRLLDFTTGQTCPIAQFDISMETFATLQLLREEYFYINKHRYVLVYTPE